MQNYRLTSYFAVSKTRLSEDGKTMSAEKNIKQRSLSLKRPLTPKKSPTTPPSKQCTTPNKVEVPGASTMCVVNLVSDSEDEAPPTKRQNITMPTESDLCTPERLESFQTPATDDTSSSDDFKQKISPALNSSAQSSESIVCNVSPSAVWVSPKTPSKPPRTPSKSPSTPSPRTKYFSPTKKRFIPKRSPVKRKLSLPYSSSQGSYSEKKLDDKTSFLLTIVNKFLGSDSLRRLLEEDSEILLNKFVFLDYVGMKLVCRLYWHQPGWYNAEEVVKITEVNDLTETITSLVDCGFILLSKSEGKAIMELDDYLKILRKPDLDGICKMLKLKTNSKQNAVMSLKSFCKQSPISNFFTKEKKSNQARVMELLQSTAGICYKMTDLARTTLYNLYVLMYLGMDFNIIRDKKLEYMLLLEKSNNETYPVSKDIILDDASFVFQNKEEFYSYVEAFKVYEDYLANEDAIENCAKIIRQAYELYKGIDKQQMKRYQSLPTWLRKYTAASAYVKIMEKGVQVLKRLKSDEHYKLAVEILELLIAQTTFRTHKKAVWYAEEALILQKYLKDTEKAAKVLIEGFKSDLSEQLKDAMKPRAKLLANQKNLVLEDSLRDQLRRYATTQEILESNLPGAHVYKQPMDNFNARGKLKFTERTADGRATLSVEDICRSHYLRNGEFTHGEHWEGDIAITLFTLLFFDIIYSQPCVAGVFLTHYQRYPLDMFCESFYINRKQDIDDRLKSIEEGTEDEIIRRMKTCWDERPESELSDIRRKTEGMQWDNVSMVTSCLGPRATGAICRRLATNYAYCRSGFPDLTLWNQHTKKIRFLEVKSDSDKPSVKQLQWLQYLLDHGIDAGFCYVGVNTTRCQARASDSDSLQ